MFAHPKDKQSVARRRLQEDALLSKLVTRVITECKRTGVNATPEVVAAAREMLAARMATGPIADRDLKAIVKQVSGQRSQSAALDAPQQSRQMPQQQQHRAAADDGGYDAGLPPSAQPIAAASTRLDASALKQSQAAPQAGGGFGRGTPSPAPSQLTGELLLNTTKRQRQLLADSEWIKQAEEDRERGATLRLQERENRAKTQARQRAALNGQLSEHELEKQREQQRRRQAQDDMTRAVRDAQEEARREKREQMEKAQREKEFRARQAEELDRTREEQRVNEHNEQVRHMMMLQQEVQRQRDEETATKVREREEWKRVLDENDHRLQEKAKAKDAQRVEDRRFQKEYEDRLDRQERERAEQKARKEARAATFQQMANVVAQAHAKKTQNLDAKIQAEYEEQQRRSVEDERQRRQRAKQRVAETHEVLKQQQALKDEEKAREKEAARRTATAMQQQAEEAARQEAARKQAQRAEASRMKEFLTTQLQLQHFRETRPPETSIARPESRAKTMYSPSRYTPSPVPM